jgi:hypothetical protein
MARAPVFIFEHDFTDVDWPNESSYCHPFDLYWLEIKSLNGQSMIYVRLDDNAVTCYVWRWGMTSGERDSSGPHPGYTDLLLVESIDADGRVIRTPNPHQRTPGHTDPNLWTIDVARGLHAISHQPVVEEDPRPRVTRRLHQAKGVHGRTYKVLPIDLTKTVRRGESDDTPGFGHGATKCEHLRRGHWRHLASGKVVWVRDSHIHPGSKDGAIAKDFLVREPKEINR